MTTAAAVEPPVDLRATWSRWRLSLLLGAALVAAVAALAALGTTPPRRALGPADASPVGGRALAALLADRGVAVMPARAATPEAGTTVLVVDPQSLTRAQLSGLASSPADLVVVAPGDRELGALGVAAHVAASADLDALAPGCGLTAARVAGSVRYSGLLYAAAPGAGVTTCYRHRDAAGVVVVGHDGSSLTVVGSRSLWSNARLASQGDAALGLELLGGHPRLDWVLPRPPSQAPADTHHRGLLELLPARLLWAVLQLFVVVGLLALWRGRRLGPVVVEPLPVVVRATETVRGRARLLRAARARDTAATALRGAAAARLRDLLGLAPDAAPAALVEAVCRRTGRSSNAVGAVLHVGVPADDAALVRLAHDLESLEADVHARYAESREAR